MLDEPHMNKPLLQAWRHTTWMQLILTMLLTVLLQKKKKKKKKYFVTVLLKVHRSEYPAQLLCARITLCFRRELCLEIVPL